MVDENMASVPHFREALLFRSLKTLYKKITLLMRGESSDALVNFVYLLTMYIHRYFCEKQESRVFLTDKLPFHMAGSKHSYIGI